MKNNIISFPKLVNSEECTKETDVRNTSEQQLDALRNAFDEARKQWPLELSELPEQNRKCALARK